MLLNLSIAFQAVGSSKILSSTRSGITRGPHAHISALWPLVHFFLPTFELLRILSIFIGTFMTFRKELRNIIPVLNQNVEFYDSEKRAVYIGT